MHLEINIRGKNMESKLKKIILIISVVIVVGASFVYAKPMYALALATLYTPRLDNILMVLSAIFLMGSVVYILYKYLLCIIELFQNKKRLKPLLLIGLGILIIAIAILLTITAKTFIYTILTPFIYILAVIVIPIIMIGIILLKKDENKIRKIISTIILVIITIGIYYIHYDYLTGAAKSVIEKIGDFVKEPQSKETSNHPQEYNLIYLENYKQKMESEGYLDKYDVEQILKIVDSRTDNIIVHYIDGEEESQYNNEDNQLTEDLGTKLESNYYKFHYEHKNEQTDIYIEKYESKTNENKNEEKNADIFISGEPNYEITNVRADYETKEDINFLFENEVNVEKGKETKLDNLRILFAFDEEKNNYIPYIENTGELRKIKSYKIYSSGMSITLEDGMTLNKKDYTIRINRYNDNLVVGEEQNNDYYYKFEPVATELKNNNGNTIIEFEFDNTYSLENLKNIEIIF